MELHTAAAKYGTHRAELTRINSATDHVWMVLRDSHSDGYILRLAAAVADLPHPDALDGWADARHITKQRGGTRVFRTLDAVASALQQIGQPVLPLEDLDKVIAR